MSTEDKSGEVTFSDLLGEYLDTLAVLYSEIATTTENFIQDCERLKISTIHPADEARIKYLTNVLNCELPQIHKKQTTTSSEKKEKNDKNSGNKHEIKDEMKKHVENNDKKDKIDGDEDAKSSQPGEQKRRRRKHRKGPEEQPA